MRSHPSPQTLGQLLVERGWITNGELRRALESQQATGSRLGTCLLEQGSISEERLLKVLARQLRLPSASAHDLCSIPDDVVAMLTPEQAIRYTAVPFRASASRVDVAMLEFDNLTDQDELAFILGRAVRLHVALEIRILEALARYYRHPLPQRTKALLERLPHQISGGDDISVESLPAAPAPVPSTDTIPGSPEILGTPLAEPAGPSPPVTPAAASGGASTASLPQLAGPLAAAPTDPPAREAETILPLQEPDVLLSAEPSASGEVASPSVESPMTIELTAEQKAYLAGQGSTARVAPMPSEPSRESPRPLSAADARARLERAATVDAIRDVLLDYFGTRFRRVLLVRVRKHEAIGWAGRGEDLRTTRLEALRFDLDSPSVFFNLLQGGTFFLGPLPEMPAHRLLADCWNGKPPAEALVLPIRLEELMVAYVYACGKASPEPLDLGELQGVTDRAALAFRACVLRGRES